MYKSTGGVSMRKILGSVVVGFIFMAMLVSNAQAQMCGCMGEKGRGMHKGMMGVMGNHDMGMMHGMGSMQGGGMMMDNDHPMWKYLMSLGLDDKQNEALKTLRSRTMKEMVKKSADKKVADIELKDLLDKDSVDMKAVEALVKKKGSLNTEIFLAHIKAHEEMKSVLTPEQRKRLKEMMESGHGAGCGMNGGDAEHKDMPMHKHMH
jgi:Spy/CpxP family protein refolding chaperone